MLFIFGLHLSLQATHSMPLSRFTFLSPLLFFSSRLHFSCPYATRHTYTLMPPIATLTLHHFLFSHNSTHIFPHSRSTLTYTHSFTHAPHSHTHTHTLTPHSQTYTQSFIHSTHTLIHSSTHLFHTQQHTCTTLIVKMSIKNTFLFISCVYLLFCLRRVAPPSMKLVSGFLFFERLVGRIVFVIQV